MIKTEEKRKAAETARSYAKKDIPFISLVICELTDTFFLESSDCWNKLADLIDPYEDASRRAFDLLNEDDLIALQWVRENGGLEAVRKRLVPDGLEWPRFEDDSPVCLGDGFIALSGRAKIATHFSIGNRNFSVSADDMSYVTKSTGDRVKRPEVLDADGEPISKGDTVWNLKDSEHVEWKVVKPYDMYDGIQTVLVSDGIVTGHAKPENLTHKRPEIKDSWESIENDMAAFVGKVTCRDMRGAEVPKVLDDMLSFIRRCKALVERSAEC